MTLPDSIAWTTDAHGNRRVLCPECGEPMTRGDRGLVCECGHRIVIPRPPEPTCPHCTGPVRHRLDRPGMICERCGWTTRPDPEAEGAPYRSPEHALYSYVEADARSSSAPSLLGGQLERMELGLTGKRGTPPTRQQLQRYHHVLGELDAPWNELDGEDMVILRAWASETIWQDGAHRCLSCGAEYLPETSRVCLSCGEVRPWDESVCSCGHTGTTLSRCCPRCGATSRRAAKGHSVRVAGAVSRYREALFVRDHGRKPFRRGEEHPVDEGQTVGYCPGCDRWYRADELWSRKRCPEGHGAVRWGVGVSAGAVRKMYSAAVRRWAGLLRERGLI